MAEARYTAQHVANYFLERGEEEGVPVTPLKLIKLVYIAHGWYLALKGERLFKDQIQAWQHGPVIPSLYHEFKHFRSEPIFERAGVFDLDSAAYATPTIPKSDKDTRVILEHVWDIYKYYTGWSLRNKTHSEDSPWHQVYRDGERDIIIPDKLVRDHYRKKITEYLDAAPV